MCSSHQHFEKRYCSTAIIIALAVAGFFGIMLLGIMSAHAIQQFIDIRTEACNNSALKSIRSARTGLDTYVSAYNRLPATFNDLHFKPDNGVTILLEKTSENKCKLTSFHLNGDREYLAFSGKSEICFKKRHQPGFRYLITDSTGNKW